MSMSREGGEGGRYGQSGDGRQGRPSRADLHLQSEPETNNLLDPASISCSHHVVADVVVSAAISSGVS